MRIQTLSLIVLLLIVTPNLAAQVGVGALLAYNKWRFNHKRTYFSPEEQQFRQQIFFENQKSVEQHNANPKATYKKQLNSFSDMTKEEFKNKVLMQGISQMVKDNVPRSGENPPAATQLPPRQQKLRSSIDWRDWNIWSNVRHQGYCGSCWAFSVAGTLEGLTFVQSGKFVDYSEQQLVDCVGAKGYQAYGCSGGWPIETMKYIAKYGLLTEKEYPYVGIDNSCKIDTPTEGYKVKTFYFVERSTEALKDYIQRLPVSVLVDASNMGSYSSGVFNECTENPTIYHLNHAVIAMGYDEEGNWIIRNSWGPEWGMEGYMKLAPGNTCGILLSSVVAIN